VSDLSGELIDGRYELLHQLARGGMATIYLATDIRLDRKVAVKIMHPHLAEDEKFVNRFIREAKAAAALSHPNIVAVQDQGWNQSGIPAVFLVMELVEGHTLRDYLFERGTLTAAEVVQYLIPVLSALNAAHKIGIVHRDLKPENILISSSGRIKVADFGLAHGDLIGHTLTADSSVILGSVSYLSPEQVLRGVADSRSDIYSIGIIAYELLTGEKPFSGDSPINIAYRHVNERVSAPSLLVSGVPESLDALVLRATSINPDDRPKDAGEFLEHLRTIQIELDPKRSQLSLELDLPPIRISEKSRKSKRVLPPLKSSSSGTVLSMKSDKSEMTTRAKSTQTAGTKKRKTSERVRRNRWIAAFVSLILIGGIWYAFAGAKSGIAVPSDLVGMKITDATAAINTVGLHSTVSSQVFSEIIPTGMVISTDPGGGGKVKAGGNVSLVVSKGPERYPVPIVKGLSQDAAIALFQKNNLTLGTISEAFNATVPPGKIITSSPAAKTSVRRDTPIALVISKGPELLVLNSYVGMSGDQALTELTNAGYVVTTKYAYSDSVAIGAVISQTPDGTGGTAPKGTKIALVVSQGSESVFVPNVYSFTQSKATAMLQDLDLVVIVKKIGTRAVKTVTDISPQVGTKVTRGSSVTITVG
jgi:beta-lactam-binding protein with PASTA domain/tRNA A-37 threonylcarbamoyl transferase component Bud32